MNALEIYAREARKHGMTYGRYEAAIRNGELPPPKTPKQHKTHTPTLRADDSVPTYRKCKRCEKMFALPAPDSKKKYCPDCAPMIKEARKTKRCTLSDLFNCELCGTEFFRVRWANGIKSQAKMCPVCHDKWQHMSTEQRKAFKAGERTLERLEELRNGNKTDC